MKLLNRCTCVPFAVSRERVRGLGKQFLQIICQPKTQVGAFVHREARMVN